MQNGEGYPPALEETLQIFTVDCTRDVVDILRDGGVEASSIRTVVYRYGRFELSVPQLQTDASLVASCSHLHFDHVGDLTPFAHAELIVGGAAAKLMKKPYPRYPDSYWQEFPPHQKVRYVHFTDDTPPPRTLYPLGSFDRGLDLYGDGSFYLLDAPGHMPGHMVALARVGPNSFVLLAADCCHNRLCYRPGHRPISRENYEDLDVARQTVEKVKAMDRLGNVVVILAHEKERLDEMPMFPRALNDWAVAEVQKARDLLAGPHEKHAACKLT